MHRSPYDENKWFVDIGSDKAGKGAAALFLKEMVGAEELVTFGDNHNDIPMLEAADPLLHRAGSTGRSQGDCERCTGR